MRRFLENRCLGRAGDFRQRNGAGGELDGEQREAGRWRMQAGDGGAGRWGHGVGAGLGWAVKRAGLRLLSCWSTSPSCWVIFTPYCHKSAKSPLNAAAGKCPHSAPDTLRCFTDHAPHPRAECPHRPRHHTPPPSQEPG